MDATEFNAAQLLLGLNNTELANALGTDDGSLSRWKKGKARIPTYIEVSLRLLEAKILTETIVPLCIQEITALYKKIQSYGKSISQYLADLMREDIKRQDKPVRKITYTPAEIASSRLNEPPTGDLKGKQSA